MFADDTIIWTKIACNEDVDKLQKDLDNLSSWSTKWLPQFNPEKCVVMHVGHNDNTRYNLQQDGKKWELWSVTEERDLGVTITSDLKVSRQCLNAVSKANKVLSMGSRQFLSFIIWIKQVSSYCTKCLLDHM